MKLVVSYGYFPLETLTDEPLFCAVLQGVQQLQLRKDSEKQHIQQLEQNAAAQQQMVAALQQEIRTVVPEKRRSAGPEQCLRDLAGKRVFQ